MQLPADLIIVGKIIKPHGYQGQFKALLYTSAEIFSEKEPLFIEIDKKAVPFFISYVHYTGDENAIIGVEEWQTKEEVLPYNGLSILAPAVELEGEDDNLALKKYIGFSVYDSDAELATGRIKEFDLSGPQPLMVVENKDNKEILIPWENNLLISEDRENKLLIMDLPDGLDELD